jgi:WD40 repeat protein
MTLDLNPVAREFYTIYYGQAVSPNQDYLALGNNFGQLFSVPIYQKDEAATPKRIYQSEANIFSMTTIPGTNLLITGSQNGSIAAFDWVQFTKNGLDSPIEPLWIASTNVREANSMCSVNSNQFAIGYGDGLVEIQDCENPGKVLVEFSGHLEQVNQVVQFAPNQVVSCSSDGTVNLYDALSGSEPVKRLNILSHESVIRSGHSRAILTMGVQDRFIICGGGVDLAKYDISSGCLLQNFGAPKSGSSAYNIHSVEISRDKIGVGTSNGLVLGYSHSGHFINDIPLGIGPVLNLSSLSNESHRHLLTAASGISSKISMLVNYGYVSYTIGNVF